MEYKTTNIVYKGLEDKGKTVTVIDGEGKKWTIWKKEFNTNNDSEAWGSLQNLSIGEVMGVSYGEKEESFTNAEGKNITFTRKTIYSIMPPIVEKNTLPIQSTKETDWDKIAVGKCQTAFLAAYIQSGKSIEDAKLVAGSARKLAEIVVYGSQQVDPVTEAAAKRLEQEMEESLMEDVPF